MSNQKKVYYLCPTWDYHPSGPIQLGNIIASPSTPDESLNGPDGPLPSPYALFPPTEKTGVTWSTESLKEGRYGLWTGFLSFLTSLGVDVGVTRQSSVEQLYEFDSVETTEFAPDPEFIAKAVSAPGVVNFLRASRFRKNVYMVVARKVVRGAKAKELHSKKRGGQLRLGADGILTGGSVKFGPEVGCDHERNESGSFEGSSDFVFAFRVRKIIVQRNGQATQQEYTKGAMYGAAPPATEDTDVPFTIGGVALEESLAKEFGYREGIDVVDNGEECLCIQPTPS